MPAVVCTGCQSRLKVPDHAAGRKVKCPKCQTLIQVPVGEETAAFTPDKASAPAKAKAPARVAPLEEIEEAKPARGKSGRTMKEVLGGLDGPSSRRAAEEDLDEPQPRRRRAEDEDEPRSRRRRDDDEDDRPRKRRAEDDFDDDRPRRRRKAAKGSPLLLYGLIGGGALLLFVVLGIVLMFMLGGGGGVDQRFLPDNTQMVVSVRVNELLNSTTGREVTKMFDDTYKEMQLKINQESGLSPGDIDSFTVGTTKDGQTCVTMRLTKNMTADEFLAKLPNRQEFQKTTVGRYTMHAIDNDKAFCFPDNRTILMSEQSPTLKKILERDKPATLTKGLEKAMGLVNFGATIAMAGDSFGDQARGLVASGQADYGAVELRISSTISVRVTAVFKDETTARKVWADGDKALATGKKSAGVLPGEVQTALNSVSFTQSGTHVYASGSINVIPLLASAKEMAPGLLGNFRLPNFGGGGNPRVANPQPEMKNPAKWMAPIQGKQTLTYTMVSKTNGRYELTVRPKANANVDVVVYDPTNTKVVEDVRLQSDAMVSWTAPRVQTYTIFVKNADPNSDNCEVNLQER